MPRLANVSEGQISEDECPAQEAFMLSLWHGYLWRAATEIFVHIQKAPSLEKNITENGKLLKWHCFPRWTHGAVLSLSHYYRPYERVVTQETSKTVPQRDLIYLYFRRRMSYWHEGGQKHGTLIQNILTNHWVCKNTERSPRDPLQPTQTLL